MGIDEKGKILIFGATGYLGKYMVTASVSMGHPTYAYVRPIKPDADSSKLELFKSFEAMGVTVIQVRILFKMSCMIKIFNSLNE